LQKNSGTSVSTENAWFVCPPNHAAQCNNEGGFTNKKMWKWRSKERYHTMGLRLLGFYCTQCREDFRCKFRGNTCLSAKHHNCHLQMHVPSAPITQRLSLRKLASVAFAQRKNSREALFVFHNNVWMCTRVPRFLRGRIGCKIRNCANFKELSLKTLYKKFNPFPAAEGTWPPEIFGRLTVRLHDWFNKHLWMGPETLTKL
jgi:hypothetical protein